MYFCINEFEVGVNDSIFSRNEQQEMYNRSLQSSTVEFSTVERCTTTCIKVVNCQNYP